MLQYTEKTIFGSFFLEMMDALPSMKEVFLKYEEMREISQISRMSLQEIIPNFFLFFNSVPITKFV